jgi:hypothetical protein
MWLRLADRYEFRYLPGVAVNYRIVGSSLSRSSEYALVRHESRARVLLDWYGKDRRNDAAIAARAWTNARRAFLLDRRQGRALLRAVVTRAPTWSRRLVWWGSAIPGSDRVGRVVLALAERVRRRHTEPARDG